MRTQKYWVETQDWNTQSFEYPSMIELNYKWFNNYLLNFLSINWSIYLIHDEPGIEPTGSQLHS